MAAPEVQIMDVPAKAAVEFLRAKGMHVGYDWRDLEAAWHARSFTVAKAMRLDILTDIRAAVDKAIAQGIPFAQFQKELEPLLRKKGWWGRQERADPLTGQSKKVQLGSPRRLRIIYDTNIRMALAAGKWAQIERLAPRRPWLRYVGILDARIRPQHAAWHGTILPWDHPFWQTHFPPNGWRCRCSVQSLSEADMERFGYQPTEPPTGWQTTKQWQNRRTGKVQAVPLGIDPGFAHNAGTVDPVGQARALLREKLKTAPPDIVKSATRDLDAYKALGREIRMQMEADVKATGVSVDDEGFADRMRGLIFQRLTSERGAGQLGAKVSALDNTLEDQAAADAVHAASLRFPKSWVAKANAKTVEVLTNRQMLGGNYFPPDIETTLKVAGRLIPKRRGTPIIEIPYNPSTATHEYTHHLQWAMPEVDDIFQDHHVKSTKGEELKFAIDDYGRTIMEWREDDYIDGYFGREYPPGLLMNAGYDPDRPAMEVMPCAFQVLFHRLPRIDRKVDLDDLVRQNPSTLDVALGLLFHYDP